MITPNGDFVDALAVVVNSDSNNCSTSNTRLSQAGTNPQSLAGGLNQKPPQNVQETIQWLLRLGRPPLPECPIEAAKQGKEPKQPCFLDGKWLKSVNWKQWQNTQPIEEIWKAWFANPKTGIGTLGGWNGKHWIGWLDFDLKDFANTEECDRAILDWLEEYPLMQDAPMFRTPSGGYRFMVAFSREPENFKANSGFSLKPDGSHHVGELLSKNGGHTLLPPTIGVTGKAYEWVHWSEYPPVVAQPEDIGVYPVRKKIPIATTNTPVPQPKRDSLTGDSLIDLLNNEIIPRFSLERAFDWTGHDFKQYGDKLKGNCPWHTSQSGTAFYCEIKDGHPVWRCPACELGGSILEYRHRIAGGNGSPRGLEFVNLVKELAAEIGVNVPDFKRQNNATYFYHEKTSVTPKQKTSVTGDTCEGSDRDKSDVMGIPATVTRVTEILQNGFFDYVETQKLEEIRSNSVLDDRRAFYQLVSGLKTQFDDILPEDEVKLNNLIDWHNNELDFRKALPSMAEDILHDAKILNIDPIGIWQYLLPAVLSLAGKKTTLDIDSHTIPALAWTGLLAESGMGKTRAEKLVTSPLKQLQKQSRERFKAEMDEWEETVANWEKGSGKKPPKPVERKYLFDVATIQAVMRRQSEQGSNGSLWARDELVGIFQSFNQFSNGESEALSCLLAGWDGGSSQVDRVNQEDSYFVDETRLSIAGGIQPDIFKKIFKDPKDSQGLQARFLFANMKPMKPKRINGFCQLNDKLPSLYSWLDNLPEGIVKLSPQADSYYTKLYDAIGEQAFNTSMPAIRAWMMKLPAQLLRIALGLHLIECYHDCNRPLWILQKDTLKRAVLFAQYYRSAFHIIQTTAVETDDISSILLQIWDKAVTRHPDGISTRDAYREIKAIQYRAKDAGRAVAAYTADLFIKLESLGKGKVVKSGRLIKFVANLNPSPKIDDWSEQKKGGGSDTVTEAEIPLLSMVPTVTPNEVSPVTVQINSPSITQEISKVGEIALPINQRSDGGFGVQESASAPQPTATPKVEALAPEPPVPVPSNNLTPDPSKSPSQDTAMVKAIPNTPSGLASAPQPTATPEASLPQNPSVEVSESPQFQPGEYVRFTNPDGIASLRALAKLTLRVTKIWEKMNLIECALPCGKTECFTPSALHRIL